MTILATVNGKTRPDRTVTVARDLAKRTDSDCVVLHVMPQDLFDDIRKSKASDSDYSPGLYLAPGASRDVQGRSRSANRYTMETAQADAEGVARTVVKESVDRPQDVTIRGRVGDPVEEILAEVERRDARYLCIGGRKRSPVGKAVFGSLTQSVLLNADLPVVTVPKEGFSGRVGDMSVVVAAVDDTDRAGRVVKEARWLADALDNDLHVVHAMTRSDFDDLGLTSDGTGDEAIRAAAADVAAAAAEPITDSFTGVGLVGEPSERVIRYADEKDASFVVTSGRKRSPVGKVLFGSVTQSILLQADRPVLTILGD